MEARAERVRARLLEGDEVGGRARVAAEAVEAGRVDTVVTGDAPRARRVVARSRVRSAGGRAAFAGVAPIRLGGVPALPRLRRAASTRTSRVYRARRASRALATHRPRTTGTRPAAR